MFCFEDTTISRGFPAISHLLPWHRRKAQDFAQQSHGFRPLSSLVTRTEHASQGHRIPVGSVKISKNARWTIQLTEQEDKQGLGGSWVLNGFIISSFIIRLERNFKCGPSTGHLMKWIGNSGCDKLTGPTNKTMVACNSKLGKALREKKGGVYTVSVYTICRNLQLLLTAHTLLWIKPPIDTGNHRKSTVCARLLDFYIPGDS